MRLRSVFKMRMSILNTATTEQMGCIIFPFFVYTKSTNQDLLLTIFFQNASAFSFFLSHSSLSFLSQDRYLSLFRIRFFVFLADPFFPVLFLRVHLISCHFPHVCLLLYTSEVHFLRGVPLSRGFPGFEGLLFCCFALVLHHNKKEMWLFHEFP